MLPFMLSFCRCQNSHSVFGSDTVSALITTKCTCFAPFDITVNQKNTGNKTWLLISRAHDGTVLASGGNVQCCGKWMELRCTWDETAACVCYCSSRISLGSRSFEVVEVFVAYLPTARNASACSRSVSFSVTFGRLTASVKCCCGFKTTSQSSVFCSAGEQLIEASRAPSSTGLN